MRLVDATSACVDLRVAGYQFPAIELSHHDWDANWLIISGAVHTVSGASWSFHEPALTTWEVAEVVAWLYRVADGTVPIAIDGGQEAADTEIMRYARWLTFTEPNLSFAVGGYEGEQVRLLVELSHESAGPSIDRQGSGRCEIALMMSRQQVQIAAASLEEDLASYPVR